MRLYLIRHLRPQIEPGICYGRLDIPAAIDAAQIGQIVARLPPGLPLFASPLRRCRDLALRLHPQPVFDLRLAEMDFGAWEGRRWDDIPRDELDAWAADVAGYAPPGGESPRAVQRRALEFVASLAVPEAIVVTHAGVIRCLLAHAQDLPASRWAQSQFAYGSCTVWELAHGSR